MLVRLAPALLLLSAISMADNTTFNEPSVVNTFTKRSIVSTFGAFSSAPLVQSNNKVFMNAATRETSNNTAFMNDTTRETSNNAVFMDGEIR